MHVACPLASSNTWFYNAVRVWQWKILGPIISNAWVFVSVLVFCYQGFLMAFLPHSNFEHLLKLHILVQGKVLRYFPIYYQVTWDVKDVLVVLTLLGLSIYISALAGTILVTIECREKFWGPNYSVKVDKSLTCIWRSSTFGKL